MEHEEHRSQLLRSTASVAGPTLVSRVLGYVRDLLQAYFLGTGGSADAFTANRLITSETPDESSRNDIIPRQTSCVFGRRVDDGECEGTQAVETDNPT